MKKIALALASLVLFSTPAMAVDFGIVAGSGASSSTSQALSGSQGSSASFIAGATVQQSSGAANSNGFGASSISGNNQLAVSNHTSQTTQQGSTASLGLAGSQNSNVTQAVGGSSAQNVLTGVWLFIQP